MSEQFKINPFTGKFDLVSIEDIIDGMIIGQIVYWDGSTWRPTSNIIIDVSTGKYYFSELSANGFVRTLNGTGELWIDTSKYITNIQGQPLGDLNNVTLTSPTNGQVLTFNGSIWVNQDASGAVDSVNGYTGIVILNQDDIGDGAIHKQTHNDYTDAEKTKLAGIETGADVTDTANVDSAGATMNTDTNVQSNGWVIDEDDMVSDDDTKVPTQQSVKAYVDSQSGLWEKDVNNNITPKTVDDVFIPADRKLYFDYNV